MTDKTITPTAAEVVETAAVAFWDGIVVRPWSETPEDWKPSYRNALTDALIAINVLATCTTCGKTRLVGEIQPPYTTKECSLCGLTRDVPAPVHHLVGQQPDNKEENLK